MPFEMVCACQRRAMSSALSSGGLMQARSGASLPVTGPEARDEATSSLVPERKWMSPWVQWVPAPATKTRIPQFTALMCHEDLVRVMTAEGLGLNSGPGDS